MCVSRSLQCVCLPIDAEGGGKDSILMATVMLDGQGTRSVAAGMQHLVCRQAESVARVKGIAAVVQSDGVADKVEGRGQGAILQEASFPN